MDIQNISGVDVIPKEFTVNPEISNKSVNIEETSEERAEPPRETKGNNIDAYA
ncbi:MAG: hypothetical protein SVZ03_07565 [Spirochaetota bacterium]|nr:hypothetical protein [Spirochaetota bacterium]